MNALTINDLYKECKKEIEKGNGNKTIMISQDDEGNGYHYLWYSFTDLTDEFIDLCDIHENIAKIEDTIILG